MRGKEYPRCVVAPSTIADLSAREAIRFEIHLALHGTSNLSNPIFYPAERGIASPFHCRFFRALLSWISIGKKKKKKFSRRTEMYECIEYRFSFAWGKKIENLSKSLDLNRRLRSWVHLGGKTGGKKNRKFE